VQRYLKSIGLPVPQIKLFSFEDRWLILEDLGDIKFFDVVFDAGKEKILDAYKKAIDLLVVLQKKTTAHPGDKCIAFHRSYDATLFNWEFDHFVEYYFQRSAVSGQPSAKDKKIFKEETRKITEELCKLPQGFTHRDYQSRNLMAYKNIFYIIDFQDALLGPKVYDLVCLLRDSYVDVTPYLKTLVDYYCEKSEQDPKKIWRAFDLQTVQRKLKDTGRFVFIDRVKKNPNFLPFIPTSMSYVKQALERLPEYRALHELLNKLDKGEKR
ncbi:MAG: phosphotransferase, partial [Deltaproteobacteria bacterium]|nr:phosphotransferase [Deltaproteobacteria bacterium]